MNTQTWNLIAEEANNQIGFTVRDIANIGLKEKSPSLSTVRAYLNQMVADGYLDRYEDYDIRSNYRVFVYRLVWVNDETTTVPLYKEDGTLGDRYVPAECDYRRSDDDRYEKHYGTFECGKYRVTRKNFKYTIYRGNTVMAFGIEKWSEVRDTVENGFENVAGDLRAELEMQREATRAANEQSERVFNDLKTIRDERDELRTELEQERDVASRRFDRVCELQAKVMELQAKLDAIAAIA